LQNSWKSINLGLLSIRQKAFSFLDLLDKITAMKTKILTLILLLSGSTFFTGCTIYRSPQRKEFESESSQFRVQNLKLAECSHQSVRTKASSKRLVTVLQNIHSSAYNDSGATAYNDREESEFLWEYIINENSVFESDNLKGVYCVYENI